MALMELIFTSTFDIQGKPGFLGTKWQKECGYMLSVTVIDIDSGHRQVHDIYSGKGTYKEFHSQVDNIILYDVDPVEPERKVINFLSNLDNAGWNVIDVANHIRDYLSVRCYLNNEKPGQVKQERTIRINRK